MCPDNQNHRSLHLHALLNKLWERLVQKNIKEEVNALAARERIINWEQVA